MEAESTETLIRDMHGDMKVVKAQLITMTTYQLELSEHQKVANGRTLALEIESAAASGALNLGKWLMGVTLTLMGIGVAIAGVVLTLLATQ